MIKFSIILPVYNAYETIQETITSIISQTYSNFELIICLDACTDNSLVIIDKFRDDRIKVVKNLVNLGAGPSRDIAILNATGDWFAFIDADDIWEPTRLEQLLKYALAYPMHIIFDNIFIFSDNLRKIKFLRSEYAFNNIGGAKEITVKELIESPTMLMQCIISRDLLEKTGARHSDHPYGEDSYFLLKLCTLCSGLIYVPKAFYGYRVGKYSVSSNLYKYFHLENIYLKLQSDFISQPDVYMALTKKIAFIKEQNERFIFTSCIKHRKIYCALRKFFENPNVIIYLIKHNMRKLTSKYKF